MKKTLFTILFSSSFLFADVIFDNNIIKLETESSIVTGNNIFNLSTNNIQNDDVKLKVFMPAMPGMAYMEYSDKTELIDGKAQFKINLAMPGTWQYQLKSKNNNFEAIKGSINVN